MTRPRRRFRFGHPALLVVSIAASAAAHAQSPEDDPSLLAAFERRLAGAREFHEAREKLRAEERAGLEALARESRGADRQLWELDFRDLALPVLGREATLAVLEKSWWDRPGAGRPDVLWDARAASWRREWGGRWAALAARARASGREDLARAAAREATVRDPERADARALLGHARAGARWVPAWRAGGEEPPATAAPPGPGDRPALSFDDAPEIPWERFRVKTDLLPDAARDAGVLLDRAVEWAREVLGARFPLEPGAPILVRIFANRRGYEDRLGRDLPDRSADLKSRPAFYDPRTRIVWVNFGSPSRSVAARALVHETVHALLDATRGSVPPPDRGAFACEAIALHAEEDALAPAWDRGVADRVWLAPALRSVRRAGGWRPLGEILGADLGGLYASPGYEGFAYGSALARFFLAEGADLRRREAFLEWLGLLYRGRGTPARLERLLGAPIASLEADWTRLLDRLAGNP
ncbi:MAG: hypothetical protein L0216_10515 [Planctomycetales bacterium]|nr:hypothetical protein [Planctomycetales bacterium]